MFKRLDLHGTNDVSARVLLPLISHKKAHNSYNSHLVEVSYLNRKACWCMSTYTIIALLAQPWANALAFALAVTRWRGMAQSETHINSPNVERWLWLVPHMHLGFSLLLKSLAPSVHSAYAWPAPLVVSLWNNWLSFWSSNRILILEFTSFHLLRHPLRPLSIASLSSNSFEKLRINVELCCKMPASHHCDIPRTINAVDHQRPLGFTSKIASSQWNRYWTLQEQWSTDEDRPMHSTEKSIRNSLLYSNCVCNWFTVSRTMYIRMRFNAIFLDRISIHLAVW